MGHKGLALVDQQYLLININNIRQLYRYVNNVEQKINQVDGLLYFTSNNNDRKDDYSVDNKLKT